MARSEIKDKLNEFWNNEDLSSGNMSQSNVVYILVQISKYYEREQVENTHPRTKMPESIKFFRDCVVHGEISGNSYRKEVSRMYKEFGEAKLYEELFSILLAEIKKTNLIDISDNLIDSFKKNLFEILKDIPVTIPTEEKKLIASDNYTFICSTY